MARVTWVGGRFWKHQWKHAIPGCWFLVDQGGGTNATLLGKAISAHNSNHLLLLDVTKDCGTVRSMLATLELQSSLLLLLPLQLPFL